METQSKEKKYQGLSDSEVEESRHQHGDNILTPPDKESIWKLLAEKFKDPIIIILLIALVLSFGVSFYSYFSLGESLHVFFEPIGIGFAVMLATLVGFYFELKAAKEFDILNKVNDEDEVKIIRNSTITKVGRKDIVVGDIILLETGDEVPADGELLEAVTLHINESTLTGEPMVSKTLNEAEFDAEATYPSNMLMRGSTVLDGYGVMRVLKVGDNTEYGKVYVGAQIDNKIKTPLTIQLEKLGSIIAKISYIIAILVVVGRLIVYLNGHSTIEWIDFSSYLLNTLMIAITVVVVSVPEGLPMSVTLSLAYSMKRMMAANNLVRKMHACETMGATTVICTDKTGTLTQNRMSVHKGVFDAIDNPKISQLIYEGISVNSTAHLDFSDSSMIKALGNPTEGALLLWLNNLGQDYSKLRNGVEIIDQLTFTTERKYMASLVKSSLSDKYILYVKGAPEIVMNLCNTIVSKDGINPISEVRKDITNKLLKFQSQAMRTLGFAYAFVDNKDCFTDGKLNISNLIFLGITAIEDPVRDDVPKAIKECIDAGISVKIVTGDTSATAKEIGRRIGLWKDEDGEDKHITGTDFGNKNDDSLLETIGGLKIMSRARPMDKSRLVGLLQSQGEVVAVTGDGTNDAPALNAAQVGLSMGDGTSVAKEASDITILDNSFATIANAVMWGRSLYLNIQRFILFQMTINVVASVTVLIGAFMGTQTPITITQMLWVNLIMDTFAALALASLPPEKSLMKEKPRSKTAHIITKKIAVRILSIGLFFVLLLFSILQYFKHNDVSSLSTFSFSEYLSSIFNFSEGNLSKYELSMFFTIFVMLQFWNMFNAKVFYTGGSVFKDIYKSKWFLIVAILIFVGQIFIVSVGGDMFSVTALSFTDWLIISLATSLVLWLGEIRRILSFK